MQITYFHAILIFFIGILIGVCGSGLLKNKNNIIVEVIVAIFALGIFGYYAYSKTINDSTQLQLIYKNYEVLLSFFSSFIFSWILTRCTGYNQMKEKEKDYAIKLYRTCINLKNNISYSVNICGILNESSRACNNNKGNECSYVSNVKRVRDMMIIYRRDIDDLKNDLSDVLAKDIDNYESIQKLNNEIEILEPKLQDEDVKDNENEENSHKIKKLKSKRDDLLKKLDVRIKLILDQEKLQEDEMNNYVVEERRYNDVKSNGIEPISMNIPPSKESYGSEDCELHDNIVQA